MNGNRVQIVRPWDIIPLEAIGPGTVYPIEFDPPEGNNDNLIAKWYAVQKNWKVSGTIHVSSGDDYEFDVTNPSRALNQYETSERTLCRGVYGFFMTQEFPAIVNPDLSPVLRVIVGIGASNENAGAPAGGLAGGGRLVPYLLIIIVSDDDVLGVSTFYNPAPPGVVTGTVSGYPVAFFKDVGAAFDYSGNITVEPPLTDGYFEFRDSAGLNPVFNKDTGVQLINPAPLA